MTRGAKLIELSLIAACLISLIGAPILAQAVATGTYDTVGISGDFGWSFQRESFTAAGLHWKWYSNDGTNLYYETSSDGVTWGGKTTVRTCAHMNRFTVWFDGTYCYYVYCNNSSIYFRRGTPNSDGSITWSAAEQTIATTLSQAYFPSLCIDSTGAPWIAYKENSQVQVIHTTSTDGTWSTAAGFPYVAAASLGVGCVLPLTSGKVICIYGLSSAGDDSIASIYWNSTDWSAEQVASSTVNDYRDFSAVTIGDDAYVSYGEATTAHLWAAKYTYLSDTWGGQAEVNTDVDSTSGTGPTLTVNSAAGIIYVFWPKESAATIYMAKFSSGAWNTTANVVATESAMAGQNLNSQYQTTSPSLDVSYQSKGAAPFDMKNLLLNSAPVNGATTVTDLDDTNNVYAQKTYTVSCAVSDLDGYADITTLDVSIKQGATVRETFRYNEDTNAFSVTTSNGKYELGTGSAATRAGTSITLSLKIKAKWGADAENDVDISVTSTDKESLTDTDTVQTNYFDAITRLITRDFAGNVTSIQAGEPVRISGLVRYSTTTTGNTPSSSYPPDAEFSSVQVWDSDAQVIATDSTIVNGAFSVAFNTPNLIKTNVYYAYIAMADSDYVDGLAPDGDTVTINTTSAFFLSALISQAAAMFGATFPGFSDFLAGFADMVGSVAAFYGSSVTLIVDGITMAFKVVVGCGTFIFDWLSRILTTMAAITSTTLAILDGSSSVQTGLGNIWTLLSLTQTSTLSFVSYMIVIFWLESIDEREKRQGGGWISIMVSDIQIVSYVVSTIFEYSWMVFNFVFNAITTLAGLLV